MLNIFEKIFTTLQVANIVARPFVQSLQTLLNESENPDIYAKQSARHILFDVLSPLIGFKKHNVSPDDSQFLEDHIFNYAVTEPLYHHLFDGGELSFIRKWLAGQIVYSFIDRIMHFVESGRCFGSGQKIDPWINYIIENEVKINDKACFAGASLSNAHLQISLDTKKADNEFWLAQDIQTCSRKYGNQFILFPFSHRREEKGISSSHSGFIFIDREKKTIERFEPHGDFREWDVSYLNDYFKTYLGKLMPGYKYIPPSEFCPVLGPQPYAEQKEDITSCPSAESGYCTVFSLIFAHLRLLLYDFPPEVGIVKLMEFPPEFVLSLVKRYMNWIDFIIV